MSATGIVSGGPSERRRPRRGSLAVAAVAFAGLLASGCNGDSSGDTGAGGDGELVDWPRFGRVEERTHYLAGDLNPPLRHLWQLNEEVLIEFPPAVRDGVLYLADKFGNLRALRGSDGEVLWDRSEAGSRDKGPPSDVTGPVYADGVLYVAKFSGEVLAIDPETGATRWDVLLPSRIQSSPIVIGKTLYVGSDKGLLFALDTSDGHRRWAFRAPHPIESSPSFDSGRIYAADYGGNIYALDASSGRRIWRADTTKLGPGGSGGFYSSPAVAGGRVYVARDDGTVYAVDAQRGRYEWSFEAGRFIYGSPAVAAVRGTPLTVYVGSYDGTLYALDAGSGKVRWRYRVGGPVPGTATVIGRTVYTSSFKTRKTVGVDAITHRRTFEFESPGYTPMVSDGERLYLAGYSSLHAFVPR